jgi:hypothetical protein
LIEDNHEEEEMIGKARREIALQMQQEREEEELKKTRQLQAEEKR